MLHIKSSALGYVVHLSGIGMDFGNYEEVKEITMM